MANENKVKFGLKNVHYAPITLSENKIIFQPPVRIPGAVNLSLDIESEETEFEADDMVYWSTYSDSAYKGTAEFARIIDQFRKDILRDREDETSHVLEENLSRETAPFALLYEVNGDQKASRRVLYSCSVGRAGENAQTSGKNKTPQTETMNMTAVPLANGTVRCRTTAKTPQETFGNWYKSVYLLPAMVQEMAELGYTVEAVSREQEV